MARIPRTLVLPALLATLLVPTSASAGVAPPLETSAAAVTAGLASGQVQLGLVLGGLSSPTAIANAGDGSGRLFIAQQGGAVRVVANNTLQGGSFLNVTSLSTGFTSGGERGLLGLAFHPSFETNRKFYAYYTDGGGDLRISEFTANAAGTAWNGVEPVHLIAIEHSSQSNHNGGQLLFGPDGYMYIFTGDGGGGGDPFCAAQSTSSLLGKVLRVSVPGNGTYSNPGGNLSGSIWDLGLRNPWRASFDRLTGDLWIGDVGQGGYEEIDFKPAGGGGGWNWGWSQREGAHPFSDGSPCPPSGIAATDPIAEYQQGSPKAVTGGFVYRGSLEPDLVGHYIFTDFYSGSLWSLANGGVTSHGSTGLNISSFGESEAGELYAVDLPAGQLYRVVGPPFIDIASSQFYYDILWIYGQGITTGCGNRMYCPDQAVTRQEMASFLVRALDIPPTSTDFFTDDETSIHEADINALAAHGTTTGCGGGRYCPLDSVTRGEMAAFLHRALT